MTYPSHWMPPCDGSAHDLVERTRRGREQAQRLPDGTMLPDDARVGLEMAAYVSRALGSDAARVASIIMSTGYRPRVTTLRRRLGDALYTRMAETGLLYIDGATERAQATPHVAIEYWAAHHCEEIDDE